MSLARKDLYSFGADLNPKCHKCPNYLDYNYEGWYWCRDCDRLKEPAADYSNASKKELDVFHALHGRKK
jgi:hypothetical protein